MGVDSSLDDDLLHVVGHTGSSRLNSSRNVNREAPADFSSSEDESLAKRSGRPRSTFTGQGHDSGSDGEDNNDSDSDNSVGSDLYKDDEDKAKLDAMSELQRELILSERSEKRAEHRRKKEMKRSRMLQKGSYKSEMDSFPRRSTRTKQDSALGQLRARKEEKVAKQMRKLHLGEMAQKNKSRDGHSSDGGLSADEGPARSRSEDKDMGSEGQDEEESDHHDDGGIHADRNKRVLKGIPSSADSALANDSRVVRESLASLQTKSATIEELQEIVLSREQLFKWCWDPFFEEVVVGCLVRVGIGHGKSGQPVYRVCEIASVDAKDVSKPYKFEGRMTHKYLDCKWGNSRARWQMAWISNKQPSFQEFNELFRELERGGNRRLSVVEVKKRKQQLQRAMNYVYTGEDVKRVVELKRMAELTPKNLALEKDRLSKELKIAEGKGDEVEVSRVLKLLMSLSKNRSGVEERSDLKKGNKLLEMNKKNKEENFRIMSEAAALNTKDEEDQFKRRWTTPQNYYRVPKSSVVQEVEEPDQVEPLTKPETTAPEKKMIIPSVVTGEAPHVDPVVAAFLAKHKSNLSSSIDCLLQWSNAQDAFMARKRKLEAKYGPEVDAVSSKRVGTMLTVGDYKRRHGLHY